MKKEKLSQLRSKIIDKVEKEQWMEAWFFPEYNDVKGYLGTQDIIFLGLNPSYGHFPSKYDKFFYNQLKIYGFANAHLTDLIKIRETNDRIPVLLADQNILEQQFDFLREEFEIVRPKTVVTLGGKCYDAFTKNFHDTHAEVIKIRHYSSIRFPKNRKLFADEIKLLNDIY